MKADRASALRDLTKLFDGIPIKISKYVSPDFKGAKGYLYHYSLKIGTNDPNKHFVAVFKSMPDPEQTLTDALLSFARAIKRAQERQR